MSRLFALAIAALTVGCYDPGYGYDYPPSGYVATAQPYYYSGRPTYWYGNAWHYREGAGWNHYRAEPAPLRTYRMQQSQVRVVGRTYERRR